MKYEVLAEQDHPVEVEVDIYTGSATVRVGRVSYEADSLVLSVYDNGDTCLGEVKFKLSALCKSLGFGWHPDIV